MNAPKPEMGPAPLLWLQKVFSSGCRSSTLWVVSFLVRLLDKTLLLLPAHYRPEALDAPLAGLGAIFAFLVLFVTGLLVTNFLGRRLVSYWEGVLQRIPLVRSVYGSIKGFTGRLFARTTAFAAW